FRFPSLRPWLPAVGSWFPIVSLRPPASAFGSLSTGFRFPALRPWLPAAGVRLVLWCVGFRAVFIRSAEGEPRLEARALDVARNVEAIPRILVLASRTPVAAAALAAFAALTGFAALRLPIAEWRPRTIALLEPL